MVISLFDIDLPVLAKHKSEFEAIGTKVIVSDFDWITVCNDKWETYRFLKNNNFNVPKTYLSYCDVITALKNGDVQYPIMIKPRFGCGSIAKFEADDEESLKYCYNRSKRLVEDSYLKYESEAVDDKIIFQEYLCGQEYGVDIINDLNGNFLIANVKKKLEMRAGETDISETVFEPAVQCEAERIGRLSGHIANLDCDFFLVDGKPYVLEMNARFGGGYPFSHIAGCNLPKAIIDWYMSREVSLESLKARIGIRAYKELFVTLDKR